MGANPKIAPSTANHLLSTTSVVSYIQYQPQEIDYRVFDTASYEVLRLTSKPLQVIANGIELSEQSQLTGPGWVWKPYATGGALKIFRSGGNSVEINWYPLSVTQVSGQALAAQLYPNPANNRVTLSFNLSRAQNAVIAVTNVNGQKVIETRTEAQSGLNTQPISIAGLASGIYFIKLTAAEGSTLNKLVIAEK